MSSKNMKRLGVVVFFFILGVALIKVFVWDNPIRLIQIAENFDEPSAPYYFILNDIYRKSGEKGFGENLIKSIAQNENPCLLKRYARIIGVMGEDGALDALEKACMIYFNNKNYEVTANYIVKSMGLIGRREAIPLLKELLENKEKVVDESTIASALFMITGDKNTFFINSLGVRQQLIPSESQLQARKTIIGSQERKRTFDEMILLDRLFRRPVE